MKTFKIYYPLFLLIILFTISCTNDNHFTDNKTTLDKDILLRNSDLLYGLKLPDENTI